LNHFRFECPATDGATDPTRHLWMPYEFRTPTITHLRFGAPLRIYRIY
jgi:hypothetical protein